MRLIRFARDLRDLRGSYRDLAAEAERADDEASYKLTLTARGFARRSRRVVDDKLSFSATLMRAGEVHAATRLLDEVESEVRTEEAALMEQMAEAKVAQAVRRDKMTRLRLVRMVAVAVVGSMMMGMSAVGMAAVSYFDARERDSARYLRQSLKVASVEREIKAHKLTRKLVGADHKRLTKILLKLSLEDLETLDQLTNKNVALSEIERFLVAALPNPNLARELTGAIVGLASSTPVAAAPVVARSVGEVAATLPKARKKAKQTKESGSGSQEGTASESEEKASDEESPAQEKEQEEEEGGSTPTLPPAPWEESSGKSGKSGKSSGEEGDGGLLD